MLRVLDTTPVRSTTYSRQKSASHLNPAAGTNTSIFSTFNRRELGKMVQPELSLHRSLRDSTLHKKHSVLKTLEFADPPSSKERVREWVSDISEKARNKSWFQWVKLFLPCFITLEGYKIRDLPIDLLSGFTVGAMVIPQGMSYAKLAGLPVEYGLYAAFTPTIGYALFGTCQQLAVGPVAVLSLLIGSGLTKLFTTDGEILDSQQAQYNILAIQTSLMIGVIMMAMGLLRLGFIASFISHAVTSGLVSGASITIASSQLKYIFGITCPRADSIVPIVQCLVQNGDEFSWKAFVLGTSCLIFLVGLRFLGVKYPKFKYFSYMGPLITMGVCVILSYTMNFSNRGIKTVTTIPPGLPDFTTSWWHPLDTRILKTVFLAIIVGFMESISIARQLAAQNDYSLDTNRELLGLGAANFLGSMFQAFPTTGSFSRSAIKQSVGTRSILSGMFVAVFVGITLLCLTPVFEYMPYPTFAAIIIAAALALFDYPEAIHLWKVDKLDLLVWLTCFFVTVFVSVEAGIGVSAGLSLLFVLYESAYPHSAVLGRLHESSVYRNVKQYPDAEEYDGIVIVRIDAPLYFANAEYTREKLSKYEELAALRSTIPIRFVIIDLSPVSHIDSAGLTCIEELTQTYKAKGMTLILCNPNRPVMDKFVLGGIVNHVGRDNFFVGVHDAVNTCLNSLGDGETGLLLTTGSNSGTTEEVEEKED